MLRKLEITNVQYMLDKIMRELVLCYTSLTLKSN